MGARQHDQATALRQCRITHAGAENLRFLATHDVGDAIRAGTGQSRHDRDRHATPVKACGGCAPGFHIGRAISIGSLYPAIARANHAAQGDGKRHGIGQPGGDRIDKGGFRIPPGDSDARPVAARDDPSVLDPEQAQIARSPIADDPIRAHRGPAFVKISIRLTCSRHSFLNSYLSEYIRRPSASTCHSPSSVRMPNE